MTHKIRNMFKKFLGKYYKDLIEKKKDEMTLCVNEEKLEYDFHYNEHTTIAFDSSELKIVKKLYNYLQLFQSLNKYPTDLRNIILDYCWDKRNSDIHKFTDTQTIIKKYESKSLIYCAEKCLWDDDYYGFRVCGWFLYINYRKGNKIFEDIYEKDNWDYEFRNYNFFKKKLKFTLYE